MVPKQKKMTDLRKVMNKKACSKNCINGKGIDQISKECKDVHDPQQMRLDHNAFYSISLMDYPVFTQKPEEKKS